MAERRRGRLDRVDHGAALRAVQGRGAGAGGQAEVERVDGYQGACIYMCVWFEIRWMYIVDEKSLPILWDPKLSPPSP